MKKIMLIVFVFVGLIGFSQEDIAFSNGIYVIKETNKAANGSYTNYNEKGEKESEFQIKNGLIHGTFTSYYSNGKVMEQGYYAEGVKTGKWQKLSENGNKIGEASFNKTGQKDGLWIVWDDNAVKRAGMQFNNGARSGLWQTWDENGNLVSSKSFD